MISRKQILARVFTPDEIAIHLAKQASHDVPEDAHRNWEATVAERGVELAPEPGTFTIELENGQAFTVTVVESGGSR